MLQKVDETLANLPCEYKPKRINKYSKKAIEQQRNVIVVCPELRYNKSDRHLIQSAISLAEYGHKVTLFTFSNRLEELVLMNDLKVKNVGNFIPLSVYGYLKSWLIFFRCLYLIFFYLIFSSKFSPGVVIFNEPIPVFRVLKMFRKYTLFQFTEYTKNELSLNLKDVQSIQYQSCGDAIFLPSAQAKRRYLELCANPQEEYVMSIYPVVNTRIFNSKTQLTFEDILPDISRQDFVFLSYGDYFNLSEHKLVVKSFIELFYKVKGADFPVFHLVVAGNYDSTIAEHREYFSELNSLIKNKNMNKHIWLLKNLSSINRKSLLSRCLIVFYMNNVAVYSRIIFEAMYMGRAIVSIESPFITDIVEHGVTGFILQPDTFFIARMMYILIISPEMAYNCGNIARKKFTTKYSLCSFGGLLNALVCMTQKINKTAVTTIKKIKPSQELVPASYYDFQERGTQTTPRLNTRTKETITEFNRAIVSFLATRKRIHAKKQVEQLEENRIQSTAESLEPYISRPAKICHSGYNLIPVTENAIDQAKEVLAKKQVEQLEENRNQFTAESLEPHISHPLNIYNPDYNLIPVAENAENALEQAKKVHAKKQVEPLVENRNQSTAESLEPHISHSMNIYHPDYSLIPFTENAENALEQAKEVVEEHSLHENAISPDVKVPRAQAFFISFGGDQNVKNKSPPKLRSSLSPPRKTIPAVSKRSRSAESAQTTTVDSQSGSTPLSTYIAQDAVPKHRSQKASDNRTADVKSRQSPRRSDELKEKVGDSALRLRQQESGFKSTGAVRRKSPIKMSTKTFGKYDFDIKKLKDHPYMKEPICDIPDKSRKRKVISSKEHSFTTGATPATDKSKQKNDDAVDKFKTMDRQPKDKRPICPVPDSAQITQKRIVDKSSLNFIIGEEIKTNTADTKLLNENELTLNLTSEDSNTQKSGLLTEKDDKAVAEKAKLQVEHVAESTDRIKKPPALERQNNIEEYMKTFQNQNPQMETNESQLGLTEHDEILLTQYIEYVYNTEPDERMAHLLIAKAHYAFMRQFPVIDYLKMTLDNIEENFSLGEEDM